MINDYNIIIIYVLTACLYGNHITIKGRYDFVIFGILYLCLSILYKNNASGKNMVTKKNENRNMMSFIYFIIAIIYMKHQYSHDDFDYCLLAIPSVIAVIVKYNSVIESDKRKDSKMTLTQKINLISYLSIAMTFLKHAFIHDNEDYILLTISYIIFIITEYLNINQD